MKTISRNVISRFIAVCMLCMMTTLLWAQDDKGDGTGTVTSKTTTSESTTTTSEWYTQPWVWIAGAAVFVIILIALLKGNSRDTEVSRTTVIKDR